MSGAKPAAKAELAAEAGKEIEAEEAMRKADRLRTGEDDEDEEDEEDNDKEGRMRRRRGYASTLRG